MKVQPCERAAPFIIVRLTVATTLMILLYDNIFYDSIFFTTIFFHDNRDNIDNKG